MKRKIRNIKYRIKYNKITDFIYCQYKLSHFKSIIESGYHLSKIQRQALKEVCPHCENGELHAVQGDSEIDEDYLWCNTCDLSMDSSGGYTC